MNFVTALPPDLSLLILSHLPAGTPAGLLFSVSPSWTALLTSPAAGAFFKAAAAHRFGLRARPTWAPAAPWARVYAALNAETCHLCARRGRAVLGGAYAAFAGFSVRQAGPVTLFPVCRHCCRDMPEEASLPVVVERACVGAVLEAVGGGGGTGGRVEEGVFYSKGRRGRGRRPVEVVYARDLFGR